MIKETHAAEIETIVARYPSPTSAVLPLLYIAQEAYGHLNREAIREVAEILHMPYTDVFEIVGFYTLFYDRPVGKWMVQVCDDVPCCYLGAEELIAALKQKLNIREEGTTQDGMFTLQRVKCLAACDKAPLLQANLEYVYNVTPERVDALLNELRARTERGERLSIAGHAAEDYEFTADGMLHLLERHLGTIPGQPSAPPATAPSEAQKTGDQVAASVPAVSAKAQAEAQAEQEAPVEPSPDRASAGAQPDPEKDAGAVPAQTSQQKPPKDESAAAE
jgi:NADH-quinone oxidoreductase subunit E